MAEREIRDYHYGKTPEKITKAYSNADLGAIYWGDLCREDIRAGHHHLPPPLVESPQNRPEFVYVIGDGTVLPKGVSFADFSEGPVFPKPMVVGTTRNENNMWNATWPFKFQERKSLRVLVTEAVEGTNPAYYRLKKSYDVFGERNANIFKQNYKFATQLIDEVDAYLGAQMPARHMAAIKTTPRFPIYVYRFDGDRIRTRTTRFPLKTRGFSTRVPSTQPSQTSLTRTFSD